MTLFLAIAVGKEAIEQAAVWAADVDDALNWLSNAGVMLGQWFTLTPCDDEAELSFWAATIPIVGCRSGRPGEGCDCWPCRRARGERDYR